MIAATPDADCVDVEFRSWLTPRPASDCAMPRNAGMEFTSRVNLPRSRWKRAPETSSEWYLKRSTSITVSHRSFSPTRVDRPGMRTVGSQGAPARTDASWAP